MSSSEPSYDRVVEHARSAVLLHLSANAEVAVENIVYVAMVADDAWAFAANMLVTIVTRDELAQTIDPSIYEEIRDTMATPAPAGFFWIISQFGTHIGILHAAITNETPGQTPAATGRHLS